MPRSTHSDLSLSEVHGSVETATTGSRWRQLFSFFGPAYLVSVGYMDPGNWATDLEGGSRFGYALIWVLLMSNLMALLLQSLSARLGIVRSRDLAQANREAYPKLVNFILYLFAEIAITACDLAEVLGMAIGLQLLTGLPLIWGVAFTALDTFLLLLFQRLGMRRLEAFILALICIVSLSFFVEIIFAKPSFGEIAHGFIPSLPGDKALYIAIAIIGATVMPHNLYLHSALVQTRRFKKDDQSVARAIKGNLWDSTIALNLAFLVNAAILILAATVFFKTGRTEVASISEAHQLLTPLLGTSAASILFAVALIAAGQSSTITGTLAGQIVMEGHLHLRINPLLRRLLTRLLAIVPAVLVISLSNPGGGSSMNEVEKLLVFSQVVLSVQLGFAVIPLIHFVSDKEKMGRFSIKPLTAFAAWLIAALLVYLNVRLVIQSVAGYFSEGGHMGWNIVIVVVAAGALTLLVYVTLHPWIGKPKVVDDPVIHSQTPLIIPAALEKPVFKKIAIALDFSRNDQKLLTYAMGQGGPDTTYLLVHVVESASARMLGTQSDDFETRSDQQRLDEYKALMAKYNCRAETQLGYRSPSREIVRIIKSEDADMLVIGAHGHSGLKDFIYGETVNSVRHDLKIPVLIINL